MRTSPATRRKIVVVVSRTRSALGGHRNHTGDPKYSYEPKTCKDYLPVPTKTSCCKSGQKDYGRSLRPPMWYEKESDADEICLRRVSSPPKDYQSSRGNKRRPSTLFKLARWMLLSNSLIDCPKPKDIATYSTIKWANAKAYKYLH